MGVKDTADLGAVAIAVIGVFNIIGTITAGALGGKYPNVCFLQDLHGQNVTVLVVYFDTDDTGNCSDFFVSDRFAVACFVN